MKENAVVPGVASGAVLFEWRDDRESDQFRLVKTFSSTLVLRFVVERLTKDATGLEKWDEVQVITVRMQTFDWLHSLLDALRQKVWEK